MFQKQNILLSHLVILFLHFYFDIQFNEIYHLMVQILFRL
nr:MAG TPA: hypothetical protein [Caudoviricetes sp.]